MSRRDEQFESTQETSAPSRPTTADQHPEESGNPSSSPSPDPILATAIRDLQAGRRRDESFRLIFERFYPPVQGFLSKRVFSPEDRLDLTQEIFLRIYKGVEGFRGDSQFGTWVFRIAYTSYLKWLRRARSTAPWGSAEISAESEAQVWEDEAPAIVDSAPSPLEKTLDDERQVQLRQAIAKLPAKMQQCTRLRIYQDLSYREISVAMKLSIETVKVHLFQARRRLRALLQDIDF